MLQSPDVCEDNLGLVELQFRFFVGFRHQMDTLKSQVAGLLTQYGRGSSSKEDKKEAGDLLALVLKDKIQETDLQTAVGLEPTDMLIGFLRGVAPQQGRSITHMPPCCHHERQQPHLFSCT